jgi:hypothetical protein
MDDGALGRIRKLGRIANLDNFESCGGSWRRGLSG